MQRKREVGIVPPGLRARMREEYRAGGPGNSCRELGKRYGVSEMTAWRIVNGEGVYAGEKELEELERERKPAGTPEEEEAIRRSQRELLKRLGEREGPKLPEADLKRISRYYGKE